VGICGAAKLSTRGFLTGRFVSSSKLVEAGRHMGGMSGREEVDGVAEALDNASVGASLGPTLKGTCGADCRSSVRTGMQTLLLLLLLLLLVLLLFLLNGTAVPRSV
jgi:hypothetical protein